MAKSPLSAEPADLIPITSPVEAPNTREPDHPAAPKDPDWPHIRFGASTSGTLEIRIGNTGLDYLPAIFALSRTSKALDPQTGIRALLTDQAGLERLIKLCDEAEDHLVVGIGAVGELLARADEPGAVSLSGAGWLLRGLADLHAEVKDVRRDASHQLQNPPAAK